MAIKTQGTQLYFVYPVTLDVITVGCVTSIENVGAPVQPRDITPVESEQEASEPGMFSPSQIDLTVNFDPATSGHVDVYTLYKARELVNFAIGLGDGTEGPQIDSDGEFVGVDDRSFLTFRGWIMDVPFSFPINENLPATISVIQVPSLVPGVFGAGFFPRGGGGGGGGCFDWTSERMKINVEFPNYDEPAYPLVVEFDLQNCGDLCFSQITVLGDGNNPMLESIQTPGFGDRLYGRVALSDDFLPEEHRPESAQHVPLYSHWDSTNGYRSVIAFLHVGADGGVSIHNVDQVYDQQRGFAGVDSNQGSANNNPPGMAVHSMMWRLG